MENKIPIKEGEEILITIESIGRKGDGVAKFNDFIIIIPQAEMNKRYKVQITNIHDKYAFGIIKEELVEQVQQTSFNTRLKEEL